ncbi:MAG: tryptophan--tRNA ligase [Chitinophagaceae bacterium]|jgi:tryptophanyl-tRNA synthetase|nr:MAG: tryptophan--tRNA ligase [Chitinophagaceae bacterium]
MEKEIVVSGIRPTGFLHLGNYFGAIRNFVRMQDDFNCYIFVADLHSLTTHTDPHHLKENAFRVIAESMASGLDPDKVVLYAQSDVPETSELYLLLNMLAYKGELEKVATFKEKARQHPDNINAGLLTYPVLMAADILLHRAVKVPVGKDQKQHLEMTRNFANRFNNRYGYLFPEPDAFNYGDSLVKIGSLDGEGKMSKSKNEMSTIYLADSDEMIRKKIMKAKTDAGPDQPGTEKPEYIQNLFTLMELVSSSDTWRHFNEAYDHCNIRYGDMKKQLAEDLIRFISPIREKASVLEADIPQLQRIISRGAAQARESAQNTVRSAKKLMGLCY